MSSQKGEKEELRISKLSDTLFLTDFFCGEKEMDAFIHSNLDLSIHNHYCQAYCVKNAADDIVAIYALSFDSLELDNDDKDDMRLSLDADAPSKSLMPVYEDIFFSKARFPALEIAYLAVNINYQRRLLGSVIIDHIISEAKNQDFAGCQFVTVEALKSAVTFYTKCGFISCEMPGQHKPTLRMFRSLYF